MTLAENPDTAPQYSGMKAKIIIIKIFLTLETPTFGRELHSSWSGSSRPDNSKEGGILWE
jgi:hypothetical protein